VATIYRRAFFQDANLAALDAELEQLVARAKLSPLASVYLKTLLLKLSDQWVLF
jgi:hypothetical protein